MVTKMHTADKSKVFLEIGWQETANKANACLFKLYCLPGDVYHKLGGLFLCHKMSSPRFDLLLARKPNFRQEVTTKRLA